MLVIRLLLGVFLLFLVPETAFGHGLGHHGHGTAASGIQTETTRPADETPVPGRHRHDESVSFHCAVSASCAPLFLLSGGSALPGMAPAHASWQIAGDTLHRGPIIERDPPVPRV
jgi:hypothetical protein